MKSIPITLNLFIYLQAVNNVEQKIIQDVLNKGFLTIDTVYQMVEA